CRGAPHHHPCHCRRRRRPRLSRHPRAPAPGAATRARCLNHNNHPRKASIMKLHPVRTYRSDENLAREDQLAWKMAEVASDNAPITDDVTDMVINRIIDNAAVAAASVTREPVTSARAQAK